mmetsp:Transcript_7421/g.12614  ORF Transcript_7421/g.12614 Transcript_7421/m.12614 type:complete len:94 (+) Transcript_7421:409-690(+)
MGYFKLSISSTSLTPGASSNALRAATMSTGVSKSATILSECARAVGIRTAVQLYSSRTSVVSVLIVKVIQSNQVHPTMITNLLLDSPHWEIIC